MLILLIGCPVPEVPASAPVEAIEPRHVPVDPRPAMSAPGREPPAPPPTVLVEVLTTRDGVTLEADLRLAEPGAPGVVLLHMIPPHWDRTSWPPVLLDELSARGISVCVPDRRGSGKSRGIAEEAYVGEKGRYDVEACVKRLSAHGLGPLAIVGASNGTTSMLDYAAWAGSQGLPEPVWLGFLSGGTYTEANTPIEAVLGVRSVFMVAPDEREWTAALRKAPDGSPRSPVWTFHEYPGGAHGTKMFDAKPVVVGDLMVGILRAVRAP